MCARYPPWRRRNHGTPSAGRQYLEVYLRKRWRVG